MSKEASADPVDSTEEQEDFDAAWSEDGEPSDTNAAGNNPADEKDDELENADTANHAPPEKQAGHDSDESFEAMEADAERLQQRIKSAEGRLKHQHNEKLASDVQAMRTELAEMKKQQQLLVDDPQKAPAAQRDRQQGNQKTEGFNDDEWNDFNDDFASGDDKANKGTGDVTQKRLSALEQELAARKQQEVRNQFEAPILEAHPDYKTILKEQANDLMEFVNGIDDPIKQQGALMVVEQGNPQQIISLVGEYKTWRDAKSGKSSTQQSQNKPTSTIRNPTAAMAVSSRGGSKPNVNTASAGNKDDFDDAWDKAVVN